MRLKTVGLFDSGIGGLSVLCRAVEKMPDVDFLYYADTDHVPYGTKSRAEIIHYSLNAAQFLIHNGADALLIACNTATSMAVDTLRATFSIPIVGMEPAVKPALTHHPHERILVCATAATIHGQKLHELLELLSKDCDGKVDLVALPGLVTYAEKGFFDPDVVSEYIKSEVSRTDYTACVLGCTHFAYFRDSMRRVFPSAELVDGTDGTVRRLCAVTGYLPPSSVHPEKRGMVRYYRSSVEVTDEESLRFFDLLEERARFKN